MRELSSKSVSTSPERLAILLALAEGPASGSEIGGRVIGDSVGSIYLHKTSLYRLLHDLKRQNFIDGDLTYDLTPKGWRTLEFELGRVEQYRRLLQIRLSPRQYKAAQTSR